MRNCASGNFSPSIPMKGMLPPSPRAIGGFPKKLREARSTDEASHCASGGASQPIDAFSPSKVTRAPEGGSFSSASFTARVATAGSTRGGMRSEILQAVNGRRTLPALPSGGSPSTPVMASAGLQERLRIISTLSLTTGRAPCTKGNLFHTSSPRTSAVSRACFSRSWGICTCSASSFTLPVCSSSMRLSSWRRMRNDSGTMPLASPECTPSLRISTRRLPETIPRSEVVIQSCS